MFMQDSRLETERELLPGNKRAVLNGPAVNLKVAVATFPLAVTLACRGPMALSATVLKVRYARHTGLWPCRVRASGFQTATLVNLAAMPLQIHDPLLRGILAV